MSSFPSVYVKNLVCVAPVSVVNDQRRAAPEIGAPSAHGLHQDHRRLRVRVGVSPAFCISEKISGIRNGRWIIANLPPGTSSLPAELTTSCKVHFISVLAMALASSEPMMPSSAAMYGGLQVISVKEAAPIVSGAVRISPVRIRISSPTRL